MGVERPRGDARQPEARGAASTISPAALSVNVTTSDLVRGHDVGRDRVRRPAADDPRLAAPGPGEDRDGAGRGEDGLALLGVEVGEEVIGGGTFRAGRDHAPEASSPSPPSTYLRTAYR